VGELAALGSACLWALSTIVIKAPSARLSASFIMAVRTSCAAVMLLIAVGIFDRGLIDLSFPAGMMAVLLGSMLLGGFGDLAFVRAVAIEDVSRVFTVSSALYILFSVAGSVVFAGEPFSVLLVFGGIAVLFGTRLVVVDPAKVAAGDTPPVTTERPRQPLQALRLSILAALLWSAALLMIADALEEVEPLTAATLRLPFFAIVLVLSAAVRGDMRPGSTSLRDFGALAFSGVLVLASMVLFLMAADLAPPGTVAVLTSTAPIFAVPMSYFLLKERITRRILGGTAACMLGILLASSA
jgi:drug/metabolite transporter (DMT)-like permease